VIVKISIHLLLDVVADVLYDGAEVDVLLLLLTLEAVVFIAVDGVNVPSVFCFSI